MRTEGSDGDRKQIISFCMDNECKKSYKSCTPILKDNLTVKHLEDQWFRVDRECNE